MLLIKGSFHPANQNFKRTCDLNKLLVTNRESTYYVRMSTDAMSDDHIFQGDYLIVDCSREVQTSDNPKRCSMVLVWSEGAFRVRRVQMFDDMLILHAANPAYLPIYVHEDSDFLHYGVVTYVIHQVQI